MLSVIRIEGFDVNKQTGYLLPKIFHLFFDDFRNKIILLQEKYTPARLHNSRVAARRMQALLTGFQVIINTENDLYEYTFDSIKKIIKILGASREYEVTYDITSKYVKSNEFENQKSILLFLSFLRTNKNVVLKNLYKDKYFLKYKTNLNKIEKYISEYLLDGIPINKLLTPYKNNYCEILGKYLNAFLNKVKKLNLNNRNVSNRISSEKLHKFRVETKTFRYLLDMSVGLFNEEFDVLRLNIKNIVEKLGEYHDLDVVINYTQDFLISNISHSNISSKPLLNYLKYLNNQKEIIFSEINSILNSIDERFIPQISSCKIFK